VYLCGPFAWVFTGIYSFALMFYPGMYEIYVLLPFFLLGFYLLLRRASWPGIFILSCFSFHALVQIWMWQSGERQRMMTDIIFIAIGMIGASHARSYRRFISGVYACFFLMVAFQFVSGVL
jgi:hypothetical protein